MEKIVLTLSGDHVMGEYVISSDPPLYTITDSTYPLDVIGDGSVVDVSMFVADPGPQLQPIWAALIRSGHFMRAQFGRKGVITLWAGGSTASCDVERTLVEASRNLPEGITLQLDGVVWAKQG